MATWYVRSGATGNGTGPGLAQAWGTLTQAVAAGSGVTGGDTVWIAPGVYRETPTFGFTNPTSTVNFFGDPTASQFSGVSPAPVRVTNFTVSDNSSTVNGLSFTNSRDYIYFRDIVFVCTLNLTGSNLTMYRCVFESAALNISPTATTNANITIDSCTSLGTQGFTFTHPKAASNYNPNVVVKNCLIVINNVTNVGLRFSPSGTGAGWITDALVTNCTVIGGARCVDTAFAAGLTGRAVLLQNSILNGFSFVLVSDVSGQIQYQNCRIIGSINGPTGISGNTTTMSYMGLEFGQSKLGGIPNPQILSNIVGSVNIGWGTATNAPTVDLYGNAWTTATPDAGAGAYASVAGTSFYYPSERNASTITIAPGSTSQSIELYLGATGLTASTSGLSARYNRTRTASVLIPLVARTIAQAWTSGGFAEVDATNMPGVYRLDLPDAALAAGADDVTVVVRGASGTNGAVMTIKLSSGGLTSAQTASAVWGASVAGYVTATDFGGVINETRNVVGATETYVLDVPNQVWEELTVNHDTHGTYGWNVLRADAPSKEGLVTLHQSGGVSRVDADIHAIVNDADAASELKGALLHNGTDYISANLLTPTSPATLLRMGPYSVVSDQAKQEINIDILTGSSLPIVLQLVDVTGSGIPLVGATLSVKIYNASGTLVTTYTGTASYSDAGFLTFTLDSVVTANPGTYYLTVTRTTGATDTSIYGGLRLYVRSN